jgi:hypothetical protein
MVKGEQEEKEGGGKEGRKFTYVRNPIMFLRQVHQPQQNPIPSQNVHQRVYAAASPPVISLELSSSYYPAEEGRERG